MLTLTIENGCQTFNAKCSTSNAERGSRPSLMQNNDFFRSESVLNEPRFTGITKTGENLRKNEPFSGLLSLNKYETILFLKTETAVCAVGNHSDRPGSNHTDMCANCYNY